VAKRVIVRNDPVTGSDIHSVAGQGTDSSGAPVPYQGKGTYPYDGAMTDGLSDLVTIGGAPIAVVTSGSSLRGGHAPAGGQPFVPPASPTPTPATLTFTAAVGPGTPTAGAGSSFVAVAGQFVLLEGDTLDTCGAEKGRGNSSVASTQQDFVTVTE
jgi:hypothetical protein